ISSAMQRRLVALGVMNEVGEPATDRPGAESLYAVYMKAGGETRSTDSLIEEGSKKIAALRERGYDLGYGHGADYTAPPQVDTRLDEIYKHARRALYATISHSVIADLSPRHQRVRTRAQNRDDYLAHPPMGELIREEDAGRISAIYPSRRPQ